MYKLYFLIITLLIVNVYGQNDMDWTSIDYTLASTLVIGQAMDFGLTNYAITNCGMNEANPLFGKNPNITHMALYKIAGTATLLALVKYAPTSVSQRRWVLITYNVITWIPVFMNMNTLTKNGYEIKFSFVL